MALAIRMARGGAKKRPFYRIVVADTRSPRDGRYIERVGSYNPLLPKDHDNRIQLLEDRIKHWLEKGAKPSDRVARFLETAGLAEPRKRNNPQKGKPGKKTEERVKARQEAADAAKKAREEAEAEAKKAAEEPAKPETEESDEGKKDEDAKADEGEDAKTEETAEAKAEPDAAKDEAKDAKEEDKAEEKAEDKSEEESKEETSEETSDAKKES